MNEGVTHHSPDATNRNCGYYHLKGRLILYINFFSRFNSFFSHITENYKQKLGRWSHP